MNCDTCDDDTCFDCVPTLVRRPTGRCQKCFAHIVMDLEYCSTQCQAAYERFWTDARDVERKL